MLLGAQLPGSASVTPETPRSALGILGGDLILLSTHPSSMAWAAPTECFYPQV